MKIIINFLGFILMLVLSAIILFFIFLFLDKKNLEPDIYSQISALSTAVASVVGFTLLSLTYFTYLETRKQRIAQEEPVVTLRLITDEKNSNLLNFHTKNTGGGPA